MSERRHTGRAGVVGRLPRPVAAVLLLAAALVSLAVAAGSAPAFAGAMVVVLTDGIAALLVLAAAGGYGYAVLRLLKPRRSPPLLFLATAAALGFWLLSTAVLLAGSCLRGALTPWVWWPVIGAGVILAAAQAWRPLKQRGWFTAHRQPSAGSEAHPHKAALPGGTSLVGALLWLFVAAAAGLWLAGAVMPPGWLGNLTMDSYDVLEYHLQLPRQYYHAGGVATLRHNVYSHYPLGVEMLFLLGMCLRGGPYEGMYLAKLMVGLFGVVMVAGVLGGTGPAGDVPRTPDGAAHLKPVPHETFRFGGTGLKPVPDEGFRARAAAVLLATAPWLLYLSRLGMAEPAQFCCLALSLLWLRRWLARPAAREAVLIGAMLGAACAVKYLSVGLIAAPVLAVMLASCMVRRRSPGDKRRIAHVALAGGLAALLFSPWLIRNTAATGNPVFPLAAGTFGRGHFSDESAARWRDGHAPDHRPPVPIPPGYEPPGRQPSRLKMFAAFLLGRRPYHTQPALGPAVLLLAAAMVLVMIVRPGLSRASGSSGEAGAWHWALSGVVVMQMLVWAFFTRGMPARFISLCVVPIAMLAAGGLGRLAGWPGRPRPARAALAVALLVVAAGWNLASGWRYYRAEVGLQTGRDRAAVAPAGLPGTRYARAFPYFEAANTLGADAGVMLLGEARAFYFPAGSIYATVFDEHPLAGILRRGRSPAQAADELRRMGVTHVFVSWTEINRLTYSYGWPKEMAPARLDELFAGWPVVDELRSARTGRPVFTVYALETPR